MSTQRRHTPIWEELADTLSARRARLLDLSRPETGDLFAYAEIESEERWEAIAATDVCRRWWTHMRETDAVESQTPNRCPEPLPEVFHL